MVRLLLIRHGETWSNLTGALDTDRPGAALTPRGEAQAHALAVALGREGVEAVYTSPLLRARTTADVLGAALGLEVVTHEGLTEIGAGNLEMLNDERSTLSYIEYMLRWMRGDLDFRIPGGSTGRDFIESYSGALRWIATAHVGRGAVAVVTHGAAMRVFVALCAGLAAEQTEQMWVENTGMAVVELEASGDWRLLEWVPQPVGAAHLQAEFRDPGEYVPGISEPSESLGGGGALGRQSPGRDILSRSCHLARGRHYSGAEALSNLSSDDDAGSVRTEVVPRELDG